MQETLSNGPLSGSVRRKWGPIGFSVAGRTSDRFGETSGRPLLVFTPKCNLPPNASAKFLSAKILPEDPGTSKSEVDELQNDRI